MHITSLFPYKSTRIAAKLGILTHFTSTNLPRLSKALTQYYMYTIHRPPAAFYEYLIKAVMAPHFTTAIQKTLLYYPLNILVCPPNT